ncbi:hypothetical protein, partial [Lactobacillus crispatus]|uniref:hypothetical protein n=1 Tax=Lactobacillus crispatus TaxID=47770 RepID=UPI00197BC9D0
HTAAGRHHHLEIYTPATDQSPPGASSVRLGAVGKVGNVRSFNARLWSPVRATLPFSMNTLSPRFCAEARKRAWAVSKRAIITPHVK